MPADFSFAVAPDHPALPGHFPGHPVVPGVLVLAHVVAALVRTRGPVRVTGIPQAKFLAPLAPGEACTVAFTAVGAGSASFECTAGSRVIARGRLEFEGDGDAR